MKQIVEYISFNWVSWLLTLISTSGVVGVKWLHKHFQAEEKKIFAMQIGMQALIRGKIIEYYNQYTELDYCPIYIQDTLLQLEKAYNQLCEEDLTKELIDKIMVLPTEKKGK